MQGFQRDAPDAHALEAPKKVIRFGGSDSVKAEKLVA